MDIQALLQKLLGNAPADPAAAPPDVMAPPLDPAAMSTKVPHEPSMDFLDQNLHGSIPFVPNDPERFGPPGEQQDLYGDLLARQANGGRPPPRRATHAPPFDPSMFDAFIKR